MNEDRCKHCVDRIGRAIANADNAEFENYREYYTKLGAAAFDEVIEIMGDTEDRHEYRGTD